MTALKGLVKELANTGSSLSVIENAKVISVDKSECTCVVMLTDVELELDDVTLKTVTGKADDLGLVVFPKVGSYVTICMVDDDTEMLRVLDCTEIESVSLKVGAAIKLELKNTGIVELAFTQLILAGGLNGGLPMIAPLVKHINALEDKVNDAIDQLKSHKHPGVSAGTSLSGAPVITLDKLNKTKRDDLENKNVIQ